MTSCIHCARQFVGDEPAYVIEYCTARQTCSSPAEHEAIGPVCGDCHEAMTTERDEAYERAAARYDGTGRDWR